jgi:hypothetical protein
MKETTRIIKTVGLLISGCSFLPEIVFVAAQLAFPDQTEISIFIYKIVMIALTKIFITITSHVATAVAPVTAAYSAVLLQPLQH